MMRTLGRSGNSVRLGPQYLAAFPEQWGTTIIAQLVVLSPAHAMVVNCANYLSTGRLTTPMLREGRTKHPVVANCGTKAWMIVPGRVTGIVSGGPHGTSQ